MAKHKKKPTHDPEETHMGNVIRDSLIRLGYVEKRVSLSKVAEEIERNSGEKLSRQRLYNILESPTITPKTLGMLAKGLGLSELELLSGKVDRRTKE